MIFLISVVFILIANPTLLLMFRTTAHQNSGYHCPTLAIVYGMGNAVSLAAPARDQRDTSSKRPSRFDYPQQSGRYRVPLLHRRLLICSAGFSG